MKESDDKFQDATLANNSPAAGEKENGRQAALDVGIATNNDTNITNSDKVDKVRELLGQRMTPEERERKKKELIEKQKEARQRAGRTEEVQLNGENTNVTDTNATNAIQPTQPRENLILPAIKFLSSPQVRNANEDKKVKFLLSKGLTQAEIDIAKNRVDKEVLHIIPFFCEVTFWRFYKRNSSSNNFYLQNGTFFKKISAIGNSSSCQPTDDGF